MTGLSQGNATLDCAYMRSFEGKSSVVKTVTYHVYVSKDHKITVLDRVEK